jgi:hypothetical protein
MPVVIASKTEYTGTVTPSALNTETTVIEVPAQSDTYIVEGWINLSQLQSGDTVVIKIYVAVDGVNYYTYATVAYNGPVPDPIIRVHSMQLCKNMKFKVTITQTAGTTLRSFPYGFIVEVMGTV